MNTIASTGLTLLMIFLAIVVVLVIVTMILETIDNKRIEIRVANMYKDKHNKK
jgi:hypothetical protein